MELFSKSVRAKSKMFTLICILYLIFNGCMGFPIAGNDLFDTLCAIAIFICISAFFACLYSNNPRKAFGVAFLSNAVGFIIRIIMQLSGSVESKDYNVFTIIVLLFFVPLFVFVIYLLIKNTFKNELSKNSNV